jgi:hypothetical protein
MKKYIILKSYLICNLSYSCLPVDNFNFRLPSTTLSSYEASLGGICITNPKIPSL